MQTVLSWWSSGNGFCLWFPPKLGNQTAQLTSSYLRIIPTGYLLINNGQRIKEGIDQHNQKWLMEKLNHKG